MKKLFGVIILILHIAVFGQKTNEILCDINVDIISEISIPDTTIAMFQSNICKIKQSIQMFKSKEDTICFYLTKPSNVDFLNFIFFQKIVVREKNSDETIPHVFESNILKIASPKKDCILEIEYYYQPDYFYFGNGKGGCIFCPIQQSWFSWFFSIPNMIINDLIVNVPEHLYLFSNLTVKKKEGEKYYFFTDFFQDSGISFFWIEKRFYEKVETTIEENKYVFYLLRGHEMTGDSTSCFTMLSPSIRVDDKMINQCLLEQNRYVQSIEKLFHKKVNIDIVEAYLDISEGSDTIRWGSAFLLSDNQALIFMDISFWKGSLYLHEMIHTYNIILPSRNDSSYYFFHESMTEFLAVYNKYNLRQSRDSIYEIKILKYVNQKQEYSSIFEVDKNESNLSFGGTFGIVYLKTPFVIYCFAKKIGEERFLEILSRFYKQINETKIVNFQVFEEILKSNGISDEDWDWFVKNL